MPVPWGLFPLLSMRDGVIDTVTEQQQDMPLWSSCDVNKSQGLYGGVSFRQADAEYIRGGSVLSLSLSLSPRFQWFLLSRVSLFMVNR